MTYIMSCVWLDYMVKYFQCKNCVGSSLKTKKCVASFLVPGDKNPKVVTFGFFLSKSETIGEFGTDVQKKALASGSKQSALPEKSCFARLDSDSNSFSRYAI